MKIKTNKTRIMIILSMLFALCVSLGIVFSNTTVMASASTTPKYTLTVSGTQGSGTWGGSATTNVTDVTSVSVRKSLSASDTISFYLSGSASSGTATLANNSYITFSDVYFSSSASDCVITIYNDTEQVVKTGTGSLSTTLSNGRYKIKFDVNRSGGAGYTMWSGSANVYTFITVDATTPTISGASTSTTYYKTSAFTVTASDSTSGLENLYVKTPTASGYTAVGSSKMVSESDTNGLYCFYAKDKAGNKTATYYVYFDNTKPAGAIKNSSGTTLTGTYTNTAFNYTVSDSESGINYVQYMKPNSTSWASYTSGTTIAATATNGKYQFRAVDKAGNYSETAVIYLDSVNPVGVLYSGASAVSSGAKSTASYIKYVASDSLSGIKAVYVKKPGTSSYVSYANGEQITANGTYSFYCVDNAGNSSSIVTISLDNTKPTLSILNGSFGGTLSDSFSVTASDNIGGVTLYFKAPSSSSFVQVSGTTMSVSKIMPDGTYQFYAVDGYGNTSATYSVTLSIAAPVAQVVKASDGTKRCVIWTDSNCSGTLDGESYVNGTWISTEGNHTFVLTNDAQRSSTYTFSIDHYYRESSVVSPTCTDDGYTVYVCDNCGDSYNANHVSALGHNYVVTKEVESTCTSGGYSVYTCTRCGDSYNDDVVSANGHDYGSWYTVKDSTCLDTGMKRRDCVSCGAYEIEVIEAKGHNYIVAITSPTCTEQGYTTHVCSRCSDTYIDSYVNAHGHNYVATVTEATCTERGYTTQTCSDCGDSYIENYTDAHGHTYGAWKIAKDATCTESGLKYKTCTICGYKYNEAIPALGHNYETEVIEPTCVDKGYTTHICSRCGVGYNDTFVDALGHDYQPIKVESTCAEEGYIGQRCTRCGDTYKTEILKPTGHNYVEEYVDVTCTEEGYIRHICLTCGFEYKTDIVNPSGHSLETHVLIAATCEESGERYYGCTRCDYERIDEIPAKGHNYELTYEENENGVIRRTYICTTCTDSYVQDMGAEYEEVSNYVEYLFDEYSPYMIWVFLATAGVWSLAMGIAIIIAQKNEDKAKAKKMLINYGIGLIVIFVILVAAPLLVKGIAGLVT